MKTRELFGLITSAIVAAALQPARAGSHESAKPASMRLATGQNITPTALPGSVQQLLNPGLPQYPSFVAGEAVRSRLSPDGTTLAVLCAGQNSLDDAAGNLDVANSTQYIFLYDVSGSHKRSPALTQVIKQTNSHVGLVFCLRLREGGQHLGAGPHHRPRPRQQGSRHRRQPQRQRAGHLGRRQDAGGRQQLQRLDQRGGYRHRHGPVRARPAALPREQRGPEWRRRRHVPLRGGREGQWHRVCLLGPRPRGGGGRHQLPHRWPPDQADQARRQRHGHDARRVGLAVVRG